jgi:hypothetical protein
MEFIPLFHELNFLLEEEERLVLQKYPNAPVF